MRLITSAAFFAITFLMASFASAAVIHVPDDVPSLTWAINIAEGGDEIIISDGIYYEWGIVAVGKSLTIACSSGNPSAVTLNALNQDRFMNLNACTITFRGLTFTNGHTAENGGALLLNDSGQYTIEYCDFINNTSGANGGAIYCADGRTEVTMQDVRLSGNSAQEQGGGIYSYGAHLYLGNCYISGNSSSLGGGLYVYFGDLWVNQNLWTENTAVISGGAIYADNQDIDIHDSSIYNNSALNGAGYYLNGTTNMYVNFSDFNDESYYCPTGTYVAFVCCAYPEWICGDYFFEEGCAPISNNAMSWGEVKQLFQ